MAKKKGKKGGVGSGLDFEEKRKLERELRSTIFNVGNSMESSPDLGEKKVGEGWLDGGGVVTPASGFANPSPIPMVGLGDSPGASSCSVRSCARSIPVDSNAAVFGGDGEHEQPKDGDCLLPGLGLRRGGLSFAQVTRGSSRASISERLKFVPHIDGDCIRYTKVDVAASGAAWEATLIGVIMGLAISSRAIAGFMFSAWKVKKPKIFFKPSSILVIRFAFEEDLCWVLDHGPWSIGSSPLLLKQWVPLLLKQWVPGAPMDWAVFKTVPIWVRIPDIPPIFCSNEMLSTNGSGIVVPLSVDEYTAKNELLSYARMLVEINVDQTRRKQVKMISDGGVECVLKVIFEWLPWNCVRCNCFSHTDSACPCPVLPSIATNYDKTHSAGAAVRDCQGASDESASIKNKEKNGGNTEDKGKTGGNEDRSADVLVKGPPNGTMDAAGSAVNAVHLCPVPEARDVPSPPCVVSQGVQTVPASDGEAEEEDHNHESSLICARMVASSWGAASGISTTAGGKLEVDKSKTPELVRWKVEDGIRKGSYLLRGTKYCVNGEMKVSLTMDELFNAMSAIKHPNSGKGDAAFFLSEPESEGTSDDSYRPD